MKAKLYANQMRIGGPASEFIREAESPSHIPVKETSEPKKAEAVEILELWLVRHGETPSSRDYEFLTDIRLSCLRVLWHRWIFKVLIRRVLKSKQSLREQCFVGYQPIQRGEAG